MLKNFIITGLVIFSFSILFVFILSIFMSDKTEKLKKIFLFLISYVLFSLVFLTIYINPPIEWDLYRHYEILDEMRTGGLNYYLHFSNYKDLYVINSLYYLISLTEHNFLLPLITLLIDFAIFIYIFYNEIYKNDKIILCFKIIIFITFLAVFNFLLAISGVRNNFAISICALGIYLEIKGKKKILPFLLYIMAIYIHPSTAIILIVRLLLFIKMEKLFFVLIFLSLGLNYILEILAGTNIPIFMYIYDLTDLYNSIEIEYSEVVTALNIGFIIFFMLILLKLFYKDKDKSFICKFSLLYVSLCIGLMFNEIFFYRAIMFVGYLSIFILSKYIFSSGKRKDLSLLLMSGYSWLIVLLNAISLASVITF